MQTLKNSKKEQIIQSAIEIFCDNGFNATTISAVAKHAGIGKGTIYEYFKSKDELFANCISKMFEHFNEGFTKILHQDISFKEKLEEYYKHADKLTSRASVGISLFNKNPQDMSIPHEIMEKERIFLKNQLEIAVLKAIKDGEIRDDVSVETLTFYIQMSVLRILQANVNGETGINTVDDIITLIYSGIGKN